MVELFSDFGWIVGLVSVVILYLVYWYRRPSYFPPGPRGIPFLGYLPMLGKRPQETAYELSKKYGPILGVRMGLSDIVFLNDYESINQAFVKQGVSFSGKHVFPVFEKFKKGHGIAFVDYGDLWKSQRKFGLMTLRGFGVGKKGMEAICLEELGYVNEEIRKHIEKPYDVQMLLHNAVSNNICNVIFGHRFEYNDKQFNKMLSILILAIGNPLLSFSSKLTNFAPLFKRIPPISWGLNLISGKVKNIFDWVQSIINEHEKTFDENGLRDFIDAFILEKRKKKDPHFTDLQLLNYIQELFAAGSGTAANTIAWGLLCLIHYPEVQKKIRKEVLDNFGYSGSISYEKKSEMPYTCAFMQELFRYRAVAPLGLTHKVTETSQIGKWIIPKGTKVQANIWAVHNDPKLWKNPEKFLPERFLDDQGNFISSNHVIPFSVGPRHCLGEQLARMEVFIFLVGMVQKFEFFAEKSQKLPVLNDGAPGLLFTPLPFKLVAKEI